MSFGSIRTILFSFICLCCLSNLSAQKVGLVLSGGGVRGMAHIGVIKAMEENHIPIDYITGTSSGAIVGSLYAQGYSPEQMDSMVQTDEFYNWATGTIDENYTYYFRKRDDNSSWITLKFSLDSIIQTSLPTNIVNSAPVDFAFMEYTAPIIAKANYNFDSLFVPFRCVAADIEKKKIVVFKNGDLGQAIRASAAYPFYFKPIVLDGRFLYDGGMYNNFPADVMLNEFQPDIIIGVNASGSNLPATEGNIVSQIRMMMTTPTNFSVLCENGILINVNTDKYGLFEFKHIQSIINEGYTEAQNRMTDIKNNIQRRIDPTDLKQRRKEFRSDLPKVRVDSIIIEGINDKQAEYVRNIVKRGNQPVSLAALKSSYYKLVADENIKSIYPTVRYNPVTKLFDLNLRIVRDKDLHTEFGGLISSRPISEAFVAAQYNLWSKRSYSFFTNFYFGKLYTAGQLKIRMDVPARIPYFLEADATLNQFDFFKSSTAFFTDVKPSYIVKSDYNFGLNAGIPARNKGKVVLGASYIRLAYDYYQTSNFLQTDTADETIFTGMTSFLAFERNTLNRKQYANQGTFLSLKLRYINGAEFSIPGSTSIDRTEVENHRDWFQFKFVYDNYYKRKGRIKLGFYGEAVMTNEPFFSNYTSTVLSAPAFEPLNEMKTLYLSDFHAHDYLGAGSRNAIMIRNNLDFRIEAYIFQPYQELISTADLKTEYGNKFARQFYIGSTGLVFHSPIGPVSLFVNYYHERTNPISVLFNFGYVLFNKSATE